MSCRAWTVESDGLVWNFPTVHLSLVQMFKPPISHQSYRHVQDDSFSELWGLNGIKHTCRTLNTGYIWKYYLFWRTEHARSLEFRDPKSLWYLLHYFKNIATFIHYRRLEITDRIKYYCQILCVLSFKKKDRKVDRKIAWAGKRFRFSSLKLLSVKENNIQYVNHFWWCHCIQKARKIHVDNLVHES